MQLPEFSGARLIMADVNRRGSTVRDERPWVEPSPTASDGSGPGTVSPTDIGWHEPT